MDKIRSKFYFMKVDIDKIKEYNESLVNYEDYIPLYFNFYINLPLRNKILKDKGLFEKVFDKTIKHRKELNLSKNKEEYFYKDIVSWIKKNKEYKDILL